MLSKRLSFPVPRLFIASKALFSAFHFPDKGSRRRALLLVSASNRLVHLHLFTYSECALPSLYSSSALSLASLRPTTSAPSVSTKTQCILDVQLPLQAAMMRKRLLSPPKRMLPQPARTLPAQTPKTTSYVSMMRPRVQPSALRRPAPAQRLPSEIICTSNMSLEP